MDNACDLCHSQPCRSDCPDPVPNYIKAIKVARRDVQAEADMVIRLAELVGKDKCMAVLREFRVTKREV